MFKPDNIQEYDDEQTRACERLLVTLLRFLGPWGKTVTLIGGLVPTLLYGAGEHVGTQDVDLVLDLEKIKSTEAYSSIDKNLKRLGLGTQPESASTSNRLYHQSCASILIQNTTRYYVLRFNTPDRR